MVYLYPGGLKIVRKSGIGQAVLHQKEALKAVGIEAGFFPAPDTQIVHINTVFPGALLAAIRARRQKKKVIYYAHSTMEDFRCSFKGSNFLAPLFKRWIMLCYRQGDAVITPYQFIPYQTELIRIIFSRIKREERHSGENTGWANRTRRLFLPDT